jgi:hypothetical protein
LCAVHRRDRGKRNSFYPFRCAINNSKNIIAIVTILQWAHQIDVKEREPPLGDWDVQRLGSGVAGNLALLAVQAGLGTEAATSLARPRQTYLEEQAAGRRASQGVKCS